MQEKEKIFFKMLCKFKDPIQNDSLTYYATPAVLGHLFFNRMQGIAYGTLQKNNLLRKVNREFRNSLSAAYEQNIQKNRSFYICINEMTKLLSHFNCRAAMLKGAFMCAHYPDGYRTSNDLDLLVSPQDVTAIGNVLSYAGFRQGHIRNGDFVAATRQEIIESKMMRGETVPYVKKVNLPFMKFFEVDINFSLDYKNGNGDVVESMLSNIHIKEEHDLFIPTLSDADFFIHLCAHLYKEATTLPWIEMKRDMTLYKYCDIYLLLSEMNNEKLKTIFERAKEIGMEKICSYAVLETIGLFEMNNAFAFSVASEAIADDPSFRLKVFSPKEKKTFFYEASDVNDRFFMEERVDNLKEVYISK